MLTAALMTGMTGLICAQQNGTPAEHGKPLTLKSLPEGERGNHRLILKDGTYQNVRRFEVAGNRVRYLSSERGGEWEELPTELVDWDATRKWEHEHADEAEEASPAMKAAAAIDAEDAAERQAEHDARPEVAHGLELPDEDAVFVLDTWQGTPELVELEPADLNLDTHQRKGLTTLNPMAGARATVEIDGARAKVHLHVNDPVFYLSLASNLPVADVRGQALTVDTTGQKLRANRKHGAQSVKSGFALVRLDERKAVRVVGGVKVSIGGTVTATEDVVPTKAETIGHGHWLKLTPVAPLTVGEYALVEIVSVEEMNQTVWDFRIDPRTGDNPGALGPIEKR